MKTIIPPHPNRPQYRFIDVVVLDNTGGFHVVSPYVKTEAEAIKLSRITWPNEKLWTLEIRRDELTRMITCSVCRKNLYIYYGTSAAKVSMSEVVKAAQFEGWTMNPKPKCITCKELNL